MDRYILLNPSGNITALVKNIRIPKEQYKEISDRIMKSNPAVEQVGFLKILKPEYKFRLEMAGGEFCGNASRAVACYLYKEKLITKKRFQISVSGYPDLIDCYVYKKEEHYFSEVDLKFLKPINNFIENKTLNNQKISVVHIPGISHIFLDMNIFKFDKENYSIQARSIIKKLNLLNLPAVGVIWFEDRQIHPVVYVKDIDTLFYENSCGSGSIAYGIYQVYLNNQDGLFSYDVIQKNREVIKVTIELKDKIITHAKLYGETKFSL